MVAVPPLASVTVWVPASQVAELLADARQARIDSGATTPRQATMSPPASRRVRGWRARWKGRRCIGCGPSAPLDGSATRAVGIGFDAANGVACPETDHRPESDR